MKIKGIATLLILLSLSSCVLCSIIPSVQASTRDAVIFQGYGGHASIPRIMLETQPSHLTVGIVAWNFKWSTFHSVDELFIRIYEGDAVIAALRIVDNADYANMWSSMGPPIEQIVVSKRDLEIWSCLRYLFVILRVTVETTTLGDIHPFIITFKGSGQRERSEITQTFGDFVIHNVFWLSEATATITVPGDSVHRWSTTEAITGVGSRQISEAS